jgi:hypothetical protein
MKGNIEMKYSASIMIDDVKPLEKQVLLVKGAKAPV